MMKQAHLPCLIFLILFLRCCTTSAQSPAESPTSSSSGPANIISILKKAGHFTRFIRLLRNTDMSEQVNTQLKKANLGRTIFAPPDSAFSELKLGTLNSLSGNEALQLVQFHILPSFYSVLQLQTATNPVHTLAGDTNEGHFQLNISSSTGKDVNISTGVVSATIQDTLYTDDQLAVYQVDHVLLPMKLFSSYSQTPPKPEKSDAAAAANPTPAASGVGDPNRQVKAAISLGVVVGALFPFWL